MNEVSFEKIISVQNLMEAWKAFIKGKRKKKDVQEFELHLMDNIHNLHQDLKTKTYLHAPYKAFSISDPKPRSIYKLDRDTLWLLDRVIQSFHTQTGKGLPLGNLTSQLLVNIYMDWFDQWMKHRLKAKYYIRYADDFVVMSQNKKELEDQLVQIRHFLKDNLALELHPNKVSIATFASGIDFLGWVNFPNHRVLRTSTKRRMMKTLQNIPKRETIQSYLGMLRHGDTHKLKNIVEAKSF